MMLHHRKPADGLAALHEELRGEKAGAMGRIAGKLEDRLAACTRLAAELAALPPDAPASVRARLVEQHEEQRRDAALHYWYLVVQREAIGVFDHRAIARLYPLPPRQR